MENEQIKIYLIPNNFIDESRTFNGMLKTRHVIEAVISLAVIGIPSWMLIPATVSSKLSIVLGLSLPLPLLCITGINGDSFFTFVKYAMNWRKTKQIMLFNYEARTFQTRPIEIAMTETSAADRLRDMYDSYRESKAKQSAEVELVENVDFVFMEDTEFEKMALVDDSAKEKEKEDRKQKKARLAREKATAKYEAKRKKELAREARRNKKKKADSTDEVPTLDISLVPDDVPHEELTFEDISVDEATHGASSSNVPVDDENKEESKEALNEPSSLENIQSASEKDVTVEDNGLSAQPVAVTEASNDIGTEGTTGATVSSNSATEVNKPVARKRKRSRNRNRNNNGGGNVQ